MPEPKRVHYKGKERDFLVLVEDEDKYNNFIKNNEPLVNVVAIFKIFVTQTSGSEGLLDEAPKIDLQNEFDNLKEDEIITKILKEGSFKRGSEVKASGNSKNDSRGTYNR